MKKSDYNNIYKQVLENPNINKKNFSTYKELKDFLYYIKEVKPSLKKHYSKEKEIAELYSLSTGFIASVFHSNDENILDEQTNQDRLVYFSLLTNISNDILSIVSLLDNGFEFQSNIVMRNLFELIYTFLVVLINKDLRDKYFNSGKLQNEYTIWNKYLRMSKLNEELSKYELTVFDKEVAIELKEKRAETYKAYSSCSHNDFIRCLLGCFSPDRIHYSKDDPMLLYNLWGGYNYDAGAILDSLNYLMWISLMYFKDIITKPQYFQKNNYINNENSILWNDGFMILLILEEEMKRRLHNNEMNLNY